MDDGVRDLDNLFLSVSDGAFDGFVYIPPETDDVRAGVSPGGDDGMELVFLQTFFKGAHGFESADAAAVDEGQFGDFVPF